MKTQAEIRDYLCELIDHPEVDPIGFKREALMEYANGLTITYLRNFKLTKPKKGKRVKAASASTVYDWEPVPLIEERILSYLRGHLDRVWPQLKRQNDQDKGVAMYRLLDKIEAALWILEDQEAIDFIREPDKYEHSAVLLMTWLSNRFDHVPSQ
jgi:hypothetical protein